MMRLLLRGEKSKVKENEGERKLDEKNEVKENEVKITR
jgi:hypothetical protein